MALNFKMSPGDLQRTARADRLWSERPIQDHGDEVDLLRGMPSNQIKGRKSKWMRKRKYGHIKPMLSTFPESVQTHPLQIFLQERNIMLCHLDC